MTVESAWHLKVHKTAPAAGNVQHNQMALEPDSFAVAEWSIWFTKVRTTHKYNLVPWAFHHIGTETNDISKQMNR